MLISAGVSEVCFADWKSRSRRWSRRSRCDPRRAGDARSVTYRWREHEAGHAELREAILFLEDQREGWVSASPKPEAAIGSILDSPQDRKSTRLNSSH